MDVYAVVAEELAEAAAVAIAAFVPRRASRAGRIMKMASGIVASVRPGAAFAQVAEADRNRTRRRRSAPSTGFEDRSHGPKAAKPSVTRCHPRRSAWTRHPRRHNPAERGKPTEAVSCQQCASTAAEVAAVTGSGRLSEGCAVLVRFPHTPAEKDGPRDAWPWPPTSVKVSWAPGCGRSLRRISRDPSGQADRCYRPIYLAMDR